MHISTFDILRCPYCGGRLALVDSMFHRRDGDRVQDGILGCHCCIFPLVDGIPVLHLHPSSVVAREQLEAGHPDLARRTMIGIESERDAEAFEAAAASPAATYRETVEAIGPNFEGGYFLYRFTDPTFIVADALVRAVAGTVLSGSGRAIDICGGSGHLTRTLVELSTTPPVLADLYFAKIWLARRFTAPDCEPVCCDGNAPMPFAPGSFRFAMCTDAFMYIWTKRQFVGEMTRLVDDGGDDGAIVIGHTHNERAWSPSHGQPLNQEGYRNLFETIEPRIFGEAGLFADVVQGGPLDLSRRDPASVVDADPALTIIASRNPNVFTPHRLDESGTPQGEYRINPLYAAEPMGDRTTLRLAFPNEDYEQEYGACRQYLPEEVVVRSAALALLAEGRLAPELEDLARRRVIIELPEKYY
jgi:uncharacterized protein YbaR (Trm112 family)